MTNRFFCWSLATRAIGLGCVLLVWSGCAKPNPTGTLEGKVLLNGQPFSNARLNFLSKGTGAASAAEIASDGSFKVETPMKLGTYVVFLAPKTVADPDHPSPSPGIDPKVPEACWNEATSPLKIEVKEGKNNVSIELAK
jgi:hypothetical protein